MDRRSNGLVSFLTRTPFPSVDSYIALSFLIFSISTACVTNTFRTQPELHTLIREEILNSTIAPVEIVEVASEYSLIRIGYYVLGNHPLTWVVVNTYFASLALVGKIIIVYAFKELSRQEENTVRQGFFSFLLFHIVFLSVVASASASHRILPWLLWFGGMAFLSVLHEVVHQRFKFVSPSSGVPGGRLSWICFFLFVSSTSCLIGLLKLNQMFETSHLLFLLNDAFLCWVRSMHALCRCMSASEMFSSNPNKVRHFVYYLDLCGQIATDAIQLFNYMHLMMFSPFGFNLTCVFFFYHMKLAYQSIANALNRHAKHKRIFSHIQTTYPSLEQPSSELCIVCWEGLNSARKLPCEHSFHDWCLMWWLEQDPSCPTCRRPVSAPAPPVAPPARPMGAMWRFGGERFGFLRLPTFSIEFSHNPMAMAMMRRQDDSQLTTMAEQVREMFPQLGLEPILEDLRMTGSTQTTIEHILEGRVGFPVMEEESDDDSLRDDALQLGGVVDGGVMGNEDELVDPVTGFEAPQTDGLQKGTSEFIAKKAEMIATYRRKYLESERGAELRAKGITE